MMSRQIDGPYRTLDGIRGIAAAIVMTRHLPDLYGRLTFPRCYLAVDLFFVLSGFVIANAYAGRLAGGLGWVRFMQLRLIRFMPFYLLAFALALIALAMEVWLPGAVADTRPWTGAGLALAIGCGLLLLPAPLSPAGALYPLNLPCWSLGFELAINAVYAAIHRWLSLPVLIGIVAVSALGLLRYALYYGGMNYGDGWDTIPAGLSRVSFSFFAGVLVWRFRGSRRASPVGAMLAGGVVALILLAPAAAMPFDLMMVVGLFPLLVWAAARVEPTGRLAPLFVNLGLLSYGLYVVHTPAGQIIERAARAAGVTIPVPWPGIVFMALLALVILWLDRVYDQPLRRKLNGLPSVKIA